MNENSVSTSINQEQSSSSPMSVIIEDKTGNNIIGTKKEPKKILISNYNEIATIPLTAEEGIAKPIKDYDYAPGKVSERLYFNYNYFYIREFQ